MRELFVMKGIGLIERGVGNEVLWTWSFPTIQAKVQSYLVEKFTGQPTAQSYFYYHIQGLWYYILLQKVANKDVALKIKELGIVVWTTEYDPEKSLNLANMCWEALSNNGETTRLLDIYLNEQMSSDIAKLNPKDGNMEKITLLNESLRELIGTFGLETLLLYNAMLLKKRIIVYHHKSSNLQKFIRCLPVFVWHRQDWNVLYPNLGCFQPDFHEITGKSHFVIGTRDIHLSDNGKYDLFVNMPSAEISIHPASKGYFVMTKLHKEIALTLMRSKDKADVDGIVTGVWQTTNELLQTMKSLCKKNSDGKYTFDTEAVKLKNLAPSLATFFQYLAVSEDFMCHV